MGTTPATLADLKDLADEVERALNKNVMDFQNAFKTLFTIQLELLEALEKLTGSDAIPISHSSPIREHLTRARALVDGVIAIAKKVDEQPQPIHRLNCAVVFNTSHDCTCGAVARPKYYCHGPEHEGGVCPCPADCACKKVCKSRCVHKKGGGAVIDTMPAIYRCSECGESFQDPEPTGVQRLR